MKAIGSEKYCPKCGSSKHIDEFSKNRAQADGRNGYCKLCNRAWTSQYRRGKARFPYVRSIAIRDGREWTITQDQYFELVSKPCTYCGHKLPEAGAGLDRLDNTNGYHIHNVVPCCFVCNTVRSNNFTHEEMKILGATIKLIMEDRSNES